MNSKASLPGTGPSADIAPADEHHGECPSLREGGPCTCSDAERVANINTTLARRVSGADNGAKNVDAMNIDRAEGTVPVTVTRSFSGYQVVRKHLSDLAAGNVPPKDKPSALHFGMLNVLANNFDELRAAYDALYDLFIAAVKERDER